MGLVPNQPYRCRQAPTCFANMLAVRMAQLQAWDAVPSEKDGPTQFLHSTWKAAISQTHVVSQQMACNMEEELPRRLPDVDNFQEDHRPQRLKRQLQQRCCAVGRCHQRRRRQRSLQQWGMVGRRLMAVARLALVVGQTFRWSQHAGQQGGSQSACRSWWARLNLITPQSSYLIAANQSRHPEGRLQGLHRERGRTKIDKWVNWRIRTRRKTSDTSQRHVVNMCLAGGSSWCTEKVFMDQTEKAGIRCLCRNRSSVHGEQAQQPWNTLDLLRALGRQNKKERGSSGGSDSSHQRHALSLADRVRCEHGASSLVPEHTAYNERFMCMRTCKVELQRVGQSGLWHGTSQLRDFSIEG